MVVYLISLCIGVCQCNAGETDCYAYENEDGDTRLQPSRSPPSAMPRHRSSDAMKFCMVMVVGVKYTIILKVLAPSTITIQNFVTKFCMVIVDGVKYTYICTCNLFVAKIKLLHTHMHAYDQQPTMVSTKLNYMTHTAITIKSVINVQVSLSFPMTSAQPKLAPQ